ncbi:hypothetical protein AVEN_26215-1 [Araneus ventricosus]|uniref:Uncharacterized protein n=1 Tax=Araneus ventricosus TaxID=182803 RepID=A0A4Y2ALQ1_ARAVE|nr:hypothetical protein AVEN_26215-1 [Araneus ventricosus]
MSYQKAEEHYEVLKTVLFNRIGSQHISIHGMGAGRPTEIPLQLEETLDKCLVARVKMGFPCDKDESKRLAQEYILVNGIQTRFKDCLQGEDCYLDFKKQHANLFLKKPEYLQRASKDARDPYIIYDFFNKLKCVYEVPNLVELLISNQDNFVFNADENVFASDPTRWKVIYLLHLQPAPAQPNQEGVRPSTGQRGNIKQKN